MEEEMINVEAAASHRLCPFFTTGVVAMPPHASFCAAASMMAEPPSPHHRQPLIRAGMSHKPPPESHVLVNGVIASHHCRDPSNHQLRSGLPVDVVIAMSSMPSSASCETDEYMIFGRISAIGLWVSGIVYMDYCVRRYCWWHAVLQIGVRQFSQELSVSSVMILRLSRSGYVTFLLPPYFKHSFHEFLLLEIIYVSVRTADIGHWELFIYELYHLCMEVELFGDSSEMELSLCDVILENDWLS
ncbi:hypothetical protein F2Q69_00020092 [Brassica cretica]|uniref:Uncharacterized protein n=1 Tax=Brassica cretica TaxID=69181 RepID=A0A8S9Q940_BRACR|nr:hypothetical protein F2Q69_00020092 [Brassica cretica]